MTFEEAKQVVAHGRGMGLMNLICLLLPFKIGFTNLGYQITHQIALRVLYKMQVRSCPFVT